MKICIDPGHGGKDSGTTGAFSCEKDINLKLALLTGEFLEKYNASVIYTRKTDAYMDLQQRCEIANKHKCNFFISFHCNHSNDVTLTGSQAYYSSNAAEALALKLQDLMVNLNNNKDLGAKQANFFTLKNTTMPSVLLEIMFLSNPMEEKKLNDEVWQQMFAKSLALTLLSHAGINVKETVYQEAKSIGKTSIMGDPLATAEQMERFLHLRNPEAPYLAKLYLSIGKEEGVRGDLAFAQALLETNFLRFTGNIRPEQHNYIGIGAVGLETKGDAFDSPLDGIRAHIQHLKAFASTERLNTRPMDPTFHLIPRGVCPYWEDLEHYWTQPKENYGYNILQLWKEMMNLADSSYIDVDKICAEWKQKGLLPKHIDLDQPITWREFILVQNQLSRKE